jgi:hypothetical protein
VIRLVDAEELNIRLAADVGSIAKSPPKSYSSIDDLIKGAGKLENVKNARQGVVIGNAKDIFTSLTKDANKLNSGAYQLADDIIINLHYSSKTGIPTISINKANNITKIRIISL